MSAKDFRERWWARFTGAVTFWSVLPSSVVAVISAYLGAGVTWISALGAFGIFMSGLVGFVLASVGLAQAAKWRLYRLEGKARARTMGESSSFDPMAPLYQDKRLYLRDLAPMGRRLVIGKRFINCEIIGPGAAVIGLNSNLAQPSLMRNIKTYHVDCIEVDVRPESQSKLAVEFVDCDFDGCEFYHMSLLFSRRDNDSLHWITKRTDQLMLPDAGGSYDAPE